MKKNIIITGGGTGNTGAQAMTLICIDEVRKRLPQCEPIVLSTEGYKNQPYDFTILEVGTAVKISQITGLKIISNLIFLVKRKDRKIIARYNEILCNTACMVDVSGFALSSKFDWKTNIVYLINIYVAKKHNIPVYIMPQSFGPFNYRGIQKIIFPKLIRKIMTYPKIIYCRENEGFDYLQEMKFKNIEKSKDMVLINKDINIANVYKSEFSIKKISVAKNAVAIIPNLRNFEHGNKEKVIEFYKTIINLLLDKRFSVVLLRHSSQDDVVCQSIYENFSKNSNVEYISDKLSSVEFEVLIRKFEFAICSRYHSIVHSFKNAVPCVSLGWAVKYTELLKFFDQEKYVLDVTNENFTELGYKIVEEMVSNYKIESVHIMKKCKEYQNKDLFSFFDDVKKS